MLGWYDYDRNKNNGWIMHFPLVMKAYFKCIETKVGKMGLMKLSSISMY